MLKRFTATILRGVCAKLARMRVFSAFLVFFLAAAAAQAQEAAQAEDDGSPPAEFQGRTSRPIAGKEPFDVWALPRIARISDPQLSPGGRTVAFVVERPLVSDNTKTKQIYSVPLSGGDSRRVSLDGDSNTSPRWSPDSQRIAFISDRSGSEQIWMMDAGGGSARQLTSLSTGIDDLLFSPDGKRLLFSSRVFPSCGANDGCNRQKLAEIERPETVKAQLYDGLLYRHWDRWDDGRRSHLLALDLEEGGIRDLTPGPRHVPPFSLGGPRAFDVSPDGLELCFTMSSAEQPALSTNTDLYVAAIDGGDPVAITTNPAADASPVYSPDGRFIAYRAQSRPGYESGRWELMIYERATGEIKSLSQNFDRWVDEIAWAPNSNRLFFTAEDRGRKPIFTVPVEGGAIQIAVGGGAYHGGIQLTPDGESVIFTGESGSHPADIFRGFARGGAPQKITDLNDDLLDNYHMAAIEEVSWQSTDGTGISGFIVKPPVYDLEKRYPLLVLVHGGPQGAWGEQWSYRWNAQTFAAAGFLVFLPNPRGSTGYGQEFIDAVSGDWGGMPYQDIMAGVDYLIRRQRADSSRMVAAGGSYGGYMINWMLGHTSRFRAFVSHAGVYDLRSMFGATEELWFPLWEFHGPPWDNPEMYERWSPSSFVKNFETPTLVVHGQKDYRVPVTQGLQLFTALQLRGVPSELLYFPDEGHWILKPRNRVHWYETVIDWLERWLRRDYTPKPAPELNPHRKLEAGPDEEIEPIAPLEEGAASGGGR